MSIRYHDEVRGVPVHDDRRWFDVTGYCGSKTPFGKLVVRSKGGVRIEETAIFGAAEGIEP